MPDVPWHHGSQHLSVRIRISFPYVPLENLLQTPINDTVAWARLVTFVYVKFAQILILKVVSNNSINGLQCYSFRIFIRFLLQKLPILLAPLSFSPLLGWITRKSRKQAKCDAKDGIVCHNNRKDLGIPNLLLFQVGTYWSRYRGLGNKRLPKENKTTDLRDVQEHQEVGVLPVHFKSGLIMQESVRRSTPPRVATWRGRLTARYIRRWIKDNGFENLKGSKTPFLRGKRG